MVTAGPRLHIFRALHRTLEVALKWGAVNRNVCDGVTGTASNSDPHSGSYSLRPRMYPASTATTAVPPMYGHGLAWT